jgi:hypothetical protein
MEEGMNRQFSRVIVSMAALIIMVGSTVALAQTVDATVDGHPRINEIDHRIANQQDRIDAGVEDGKISAKAGAQDDTRLSDVSEKLSADEALHGGHITADEQGELNHALTVNSAHISGRVK